MIDFKNPDWVVVNQFTVIEGQHNFRPDIVVFVSGLPLAVLKLKNAAESNDVMEMRFDMFCLWRISAMSWLLRIAGSLYSRGQRIVSSASTDESNCGKNMTSIGGLKMAEAAPFGTTSLLLQHMVDELKAV